MDVQFVITELRLAIWAMESGNSEDALAAIEIAREEIKGYNKALAGSIEGRTND